MFVATPTSLFVAEMEEGRCCRLVRYCAHFLLYWYNHLLLLLIFSVLTAHYGSAALDGTCPVAALHEAIAQAGEGDALVDTVSFEGGISYNVPNGALYAIGGSLLLLGAAMLVSGARLQRLFTGVLVVGSLALGAEAMAAAQLLHQPSGALTAGLYLERDGERAGTFTVDCACAGSLLGTLLAISLGLHALAQPCFQRALSFLEGAVCGLLVARLVADFVPPLLEPYPLSDAPTPFVLGYPLVPFWAAAAALALLMGVGAVPENETLHAVLTAFLGAFAAAKGLRTVRDAADGRTSLELAGGDRVASDMCVAARRSDRAPRLPSAATPHAALVHTPAPSPHVLARACP